MSLRTEKRFIGGRLVPKSHANRRVTFLLPLPEPGIAKLRQAPARRLSISLGGDFCIETIGEALRTERLVARQRVQPRWQGADQCRLQGSEGIPHLPGSSSRKLNS